MKRIDSNLAFADTEMKKNEHRDAANCLKGALRGTGHKQDIGEPNADPLRRTRSKERRPAAVSSPAALKCAVSGQLSVSACAHFKFQAPGFTSLESKRLPLSPVECKNAYKCEHCS